MYTFENENERFQECKTKMELCIEIHMKYLTNNINSRQYLIVSTNALPQFVTTDIYVQCSAAAQQLPLHFQLWNQIRILS